jgi:hypothetical protein
MQKQRILSAFPMQFDRENANAVQIECNCGASRFRVAREDRKVMDVLDAQPV